MIAGKAEDFRKRFSFVNLADTSALSNAISKAEFVIEAREGCMMQAACHCCRCDWNILEFLVKSKAVSEDFDTKQSCFAALQVLCMYAQSATTCTETTESRLRDCKAAGLSEESILASNTSSISITKLAAKVPRLAQAQASQARLACRFSASPCLSCTEA